MTPYYRLSGGGNDFLALVEPDSDPDPDRIRAWCRRGLSLGADGLFVLRRRDDGAGMVYFNADGREAALCLNGTRCAVRLARHLGWAPREITVHTGAGPMRGEAVDDHRVALAVPPPERPSELEVEAGDRHLAGWRAPVGVPHFVLLWPESLAAAPVATLGPVLRSHPAFGDAGTNVDFVRLPDRRRLEIRSFERGVEAETLACGTGVLAAVAVGLALEALSLPVDALTLGGFTLGVDRDRDAEGWLLTGDARLLARGEIDPAAARLPGPPAWS